MLKGYRNIKVQATFFMKSVSHFAFMLNSWQQDFITQ